MGIAHILYSSSLQTTTSFPATTTAIVLTMVWVGLVLALVLPRLAVVASPDYPEITFNMTLPPIHPIVLVEYNNSTQVQSDTDPYGFAVRGLTTPKEASRSILRTHVAMQYIGSAISFNGQIPEGRSKSISGAQSDVPFSFPWSDSQPNLIAGLDGVKRQAANLEINAEFAGAPPSETAIIGPWFYINNVTITSTMRTQA